ncbi:hypothetical protein L208DRAFT_1343970 [Tricholoma matsutake]|nr:hypothetical protein L208DRAFT_1343970 [Tricholoma matsutake 945]
MCKTKDIYVVHRVNWLRAKAAFERAMEENTLVQYEMKWTTAYFNHRAAEWRKRKEADYSHGHKDLCCTTGGDVGGFC